MTTHPSITESELSATADQPLITILLPTYNAAKFIQRTLNYISDQLHENFLCLISDDASSDRTVEVCSMHAAKDSRFIVQAQDRNIGWVNNTNRLLSRVSSEYFMIMSHDDAIIRPYLNTLVDALILRPAAIVAFSDVETIGRAGRQKTRKYDQLTNVMNAEHRARIVFNRSGAWFVPYHGLVRTALMADAMKLRLSAAGEFTADLVWAFEMALRGEFVRVPEILFLKYLQDNSLSRSWTYNRTAARAVNASCLQAVHESSLPASQTKKLRALIRSSL